MFIELPVNNRSNMRRSVFGVGINDANYLVKPVVDGNQVVCPYYARWKEILHRCYSEKVHLLFPTYEGCTVCEEWLSFSNFKLWMQNQDWKGNHLDKDILVQGNKEYSPSTCLFVAPPINSLLLDRKSERGQYPQGVSFYKRTRKYRARVRFNGKLKHIGYFNTADEAFEAYKIEKYKIIKLVAIINQSRLSQRY